MHRRLLSEQILVSVLTSRRRSFGGHPVASPSPSSLYASRTGSIAKLTISTHSIHMVIVEKMKKTDGVRLHIPASLHMGKVAGHMTEILELRSENPCCQVLFIPGNPGIVSFYKEYIEAIYEMLDTKADVTAIGHIAHTQKDWESGKVFSLQEQIEHKIEFVKDELLPRKLPICLVGHSIGSYIALEIFKVFPEETFFMIGLYPFLATNNDSLWQSLIKTSIRSLGISSILSSFAALIGKTPICFQECLFKHMLGHSSSSYAVDVACMYLTQYYMVRNITFMGMTEFTKLQENPDWTFMKNEGRRMAFLFGDNDHWGPLSLCVKISKYVPSVDLTIEKEGHKHAFCCTSAGSTWVANYTATILRKHLADAFGGA